MSQEYTGTDQWLTSVTLPSDGDSRNAQSINAMGEDLTDRTTHLLGRVEGTEARPYLVRQYEFVLPFNQYLQATEWTILDSVVVSCVAGDVIMCDFAVRATINATATSGKVALATVVGTTGALADDACVREAFVYDSAFETPGFLYPRPNSTTYRFRQATTPTNLPLRVGAIYKKTSGNAIYMLGGHLNVQVWRGIPQ